MKPSLSLSAIAVLLLQLISWSWTIGATPLFRGVSPADADGDGLFQLSDSSIEPQNMPIEENIVIVDVGVELDKSVLMASDLLQVGTGSCRSHLLEQLAYIFKQACEEDDLCIFDSNNAANIDIKRIQDLKAVDFSDLTKVKQIHGLLIDINVSVVVRENGDILKIRQMIQTHLETKEIDLDCT